MNDSQDISFLTPEEIAEQYCIQNNDTTQTYINAASLEMGGYRFSANRIETVEQIANSMNLTTKSDSKHGGLRYNEGKLRYDLICPEQLKGLASVYTYGAKKYLPHNWSKGQAYSTILASLKRHIAAFESGEDYDSESKCQHMSHAMWNCGALISFAKFYPQGDDRRRSCYRIPRIGLDVDETVCNFVAAYCKRFQLDIPHCWNFDRHFAERMAELKDDKAFWLGLEPLIKAADLPFEPSAYITSRMIPNEWTQEWLDLHGFPIAPTITVASGSEKAEHIEKLGLDWFCDDNMTTFTELNKRGICCFLMDAKHNQRYDVGSKRIKSLVELKDRW